MKEEVELKTTDEVEAIRQAAAVVQLVLVHVRDTVVPGQTTAAVEQTCATLLRRHNALPGSDQTGGFPAAVCVSVNNVVAHGIPGTYVLKNGDLVTVDVTSCVNGWHADGAWTYIAGDISEPDRRLIQAAWLSTLSGIRASRAASRLGDVGAAIQETARRLGFTVLSEFAGHGIGLRMHEPPTVRHTGEQGTGLPIVPGLVFTIEPILCLGNPHVVKLEDGWSYATENGARTAQFEQTIAVFSRRTDILTMPNAAQYVDFPPFF